MKKYFGLLIFIALMLFIPSFVLAEEEYEYVDFKVERVNGLNVKATDIKIYASTSSNSLSLTDRTDEFDVVEKIWSVCVENDCSLSEEVSDDAVWEDNKEYVLMIRIVAKNGSNFNIWGTDKARYNGTPIEQLDGEFGNTGNELMIKTKTALEKNEVLPNETEEQEDILIPPTIIEKTCTCSLALCCTTFLNISICIWILILIVLIILIIVICIVKKKKKQQL